MKKILLVSYHFHPDLEVGAQRSVKFAKFLPEFGWQAHILSVQPHHYRFLDDQALGFDCPVRRTTVLPTPNEAYIWLKRLLKPETSGSVEGATVITSSPQVAHGKSGLRSWLSRLLYSISSTPDDRAGWFVPATLAAVKEIRRHKIDCVYSSGPPQTCHLVACAASIVTGRPLVVDFRDPWLFPKKHYQQGLAFSEWFDRVFERQTMKRASLVLTTTEEWRQKLIERYDPILNSKCHTIVNGFDPDDFKGLSCGERKKEGDPVTTILHAGAMYSGRDPFDLLTAIGQMQQSGEISKNEVSVQFFGKVEVDQARIGQIMTEYSLDEMVSFAPPVGRSDYLQMLADADILVMFQSDQAPVHIPAKMFDYLGTGNAILALTGEGATRNFLSGFDHVAIAPIYGVDEIKGALRQLLERVKRGQGRVDSGSQLEHLSKRELTARLAALLDNAIN